MLKLQTSYLEELTQAIAKNLHENNISINSFSVALNNSIYDESKWSQEVAKPIRPNIIKST